MLFFINFTPWVAVIDCGQKWALPDDKFMNMNVFQLKLIIKYKDIQAKLE